MTEKEAKIYKKTLLRSFNVTFISILIISIGLILIGVIYEKINLNYFGENIKFFYIIDDNNIELFNKKIYFPIKKIIDGASYYLYKITPPIMKLVNTVSNYLKELLA